MDLPIARASILVLGLALFACDRDRTTKWAEVGDGDWKIVETAPVTLKGCSAPSEFKGSFVCYVVPATACGRSATDVRPQGAPVCEGTADGPWSGLVAIDAPGVVCCGSRGGGGRLKIAYEH